MTGMTMHELLHQMFEKGASDLILTAGTKPQLRTNGILEPIESYPSLTPQITKDLAYSILTKKQIDTFEETKDLDISYGIVNLSRFRINIFLQRGSIAVSVRLIPFEIPKLEALGLPKIVKQFALKPNGLILVSGPVGSGKSTTLASMIDYINQTKKMHIITLEDPIEYVHRHKMSIVDQREISKDVPSFEQAMKSVFRQSPDAIMVGEMRDLETIRLALTLAETGHLILATLHTQDATHCITRIVDGFPADQQQQIRIQLSLVLIGAIVQQLIPAKDGSRLILAHEIMNVNNAIRNLIRENQPQQIYSVIQTGRSKGMVTMNDSLKALYKNGEISSEDARNRSSRPRELLRILGSEVKV